MIDDRERFGTKLIIFDAPLHDTGKPGRTLADWVEAIRVLNPDIVLVDAAGPGGYVLQQLRASGINAAALPKVPI